MRADNGGSQCIAMAGKCQDQEHATFSGTQLPTEELP